MNKIEDAFFPPQSTYRYINRASFPLPGQPQCLEFLDVGYNYSQIDLANMLTRTQKYENVKFVLLTGSFPIHVSQFLSNYPML